MCTRIQKRHATQSLALTLRVVATAGAVCSAARVTIDNTIPRVADNEDVPMNAHDGALLDFSSDSSLGAKKHVAHVHTRLNGNMPHTLCHHLYYPLAIFVVEVSKGT